MISSTLNKLKSTNKWLLQITVAKSRVAWFTEKYTEKKSVNIIFHKQISKQFYRKQKSPNIL